MYAKLTGLGNECETGDTDYVADIQKLLENSVIQGFVLVRADFIALYIYLDAACIVLQLHERGCTHYAAAHYPSGY